MGKKEIASGPPSQLKEDDSLQKLFAQSARDIIDRRRYEKISQGDVFTCAIGPFSDLIDTYGLIINARCDLAHSKARYVYYLPVISIRNWLAYIGYEMIINDRMASITSKMKNILKEYNISLQMAEQQGYKLMLEIFGAKITSQKKRNVYSDCLNEYEYLQSVNNFSSAVALCSRYPSEVARLLKEVSSHKISDIYFLEAIDREDDKNLGYVVFLGEIERMPMELACKLPLGLDKDSCVSVQDGSDSICYLSFKFIDIAYVLGRIDSPYIEHLIQRFTALFSRIGLPDIKDGYFSYLLKSHTNSE